MEEVESLISKARQVLEPITSLDDESEDIAKFKDELENLQGEHLKGFYDMLRGLKHPEERNGNGDGGHEEGHGESEASKKDVSRFIDDAAVCRNDSKDEVVDDTKFNNPEDQAFINDEDEHNNAETLHHQCDNAAEREELERFCQSLDQEEGLNPRIGSCFEM